MTKVTVIIYESNESLIERYITELKHTSFDITTMIARNLHSFLDFIREFKPQLVLMSSRIAGLGEVLLGLRQNHPIAAPLILIGEQEREEDFRLSIQNGAYDYVSLEKIYRLSNSSSNAIRYYLLESAQR
jgi:DNA-binding response OmpR family regulator